MILTNYIVRVYKFEKNKPRKLVGVVEEVGVKGRKAFTNYDELWEILNSPNSSPRAENVVRLYDGNPSRCKRRWLLKKV
jgi:hypothetical protein